MGQISRGRPENATGDLFGRQPSKATVAATRSLPKQRMTVEPFEFSPDGISPRSIEEIPRWLRFSSVGPVDTKVK